MIIRSEGPALRGKSPGPRLEPFEQRIVTEVVKIADDDGMHGPVKHELLIQDARAVVMSAGIHAIQASQAERKILRHAQSLEIHFCHLSQRPCASHFAGPEKPSHRLRIIPRYSVTAIEIELSQGLGVIIGAAGCPHHAALPDMAVPDLHPFICLGLIRDHSPDGRPREPTAWLRRLVERDNGSGRRLFMLIVLEIPLERLAVLRFTSSARNHRRHRTEGWRIA